MSDFFVLFACEMSRNKGDTGNNFIDVLHLANNNK